MKTKKRTLPILFTGLALAIGVAVSNVIASDYLIVEEVRAAQGDVLATFEASSVVTATSYATYEDDDWLLTKGGNTTSGGTNSKNRSSTNLSSYSKYIGNTGVTTSNTAFAVASKKTIANVGKVIVTHSGGSNNTRGSVYLTSSTDGTAYSKVDVSTETGLSSQGAVPTTSMTFEFDIISSATYYAVIFVDSDTSGNYRFDNLTATFYEGGIAKILTDISVSGTPSKTVYYEGESFDPTGITVNATYDDTSSANVTSSCTFTPDPLTAGTTSVTAHYAEGGVEKTASISGITALSRTLQSISVLTNPSAMSYVIGQAFSPAGMKIRATYNVGATNDDYTAYTHSPTAAFDSLGSKVVTITSTEDVSKTTTLTVSVVEQAEGTYGISSSGTTYNANPAIGDLNIEKSNPLLGDIVLSDTNQFRLGSGVADVNYKMSFGGGQDAPGTATFTLPSGLIATSVTLTGISRGNDTNTPVPTLSINGVLKYTYSASETSLTTKVYSNSLVIASGNKRIWVEEIEIVAKSAVNAALDYGTYFLGETDDECASLNVTSATWNGLKAIYEHADVGVQNVVKSADADQDGNDLEKAIARYVFIATKYAYADFMNVGVTLPLNQLNEFYESNSVLILVVVASIFGITAIAGFYFISKRRKATE